MHIGMRIGIRIRMRVGRVSGHEYRQWPIDIRVGMCRGMHAGYVDMRVGHVYGHVC